MRGAFFKLLKTMNMNNRHSLGCRGEMLAKRYLATSGYEIMDANYRVGRRELDIIARQGRITAFIEVKTRIQTAASRTEDPLTAAQARRLQQAALAYCRQKHIALDTIRWDLIVILVNAGGRRAELKHYRAII
jgi:putative endonuclease